MGGGGGEGGEEELEDELEALLSSGAGGQRRRPADAGERERERELSMFRSGSAPPTIEGSLNAISGLLRGDGEVAVTAAPIPVAEALNGHSGLLSEEELRADPAYLSYYYSHGNLNPRLPPPVLSKEDWRSTQRLKSGVVGGIGDKRKPIQEDARQGTGTAVGRSLFSQHPGFERDEEAMNDGVDNIGRRTPTSEHPSRTASRNSFLDNQEPVNPAENQYAMHNDILDVHHPIGNMQNRDISDQQKFSLDSQAAQVHNKQHSVMLETDDGYLGIPSMSQSSNSSFADVNNSVAGLAEFRNSTNTSGYPLSPGLPSMMPPLFESAAAASAIAALGADSRNLGNNSLSSPTLSLTDAHNLGRGGNQAPTVQKAYIEVLLQQQKQFEMPLLGKSTASNHGYYGNLAFGMGMAYPGSPLSSPVASQSGPGSPLRLGERNLRFPSNLRNIGGWNSDPSGYMNENFPSSLLDEFKSNKARSFELAEIAGHVVEFSADQYGSRFIQQKLETATVEEKNMVFEEIMPHALSLMTDVFGNYVVQKFFEHGSAEQRRELADKLFGHVLALSLQMYGCRVIQKKCIECVPEDSIQFIISTFYGHVVPLSTHPYGCRVIQRVLEHCADQKTQQIVMDEILQSVCMLAQDQYGNYVVQHVLEHGKPHERSIIIEKLAGQIIQMSQQKFASNVVEKCLTFGGPTEREVLINEMLGTTDENEPLQAMMKDQFGNYVVQKVLETCDDQQRELILSRVKVHLNALKKYTYGKHIVARVEKLVAAGDMEDDDDAGAGAGFGACGRVLEWEHGLPTEEELTPLSHPLVPPALAAAFRIDVRGTAFDCPAFAHNSPTSHLSFRCDDEDEDDEEEGEGVGEEESEDATSGSGSCRGGTGRAGKKARMVWTPELHHRFVEAVAHLGDKGAVPKAIVRLA
ncbi:unnamed protein product [Miscanthus lutarioriparius]|uniref:PUM-HD domain-containing protein n=1 Tax=Miscanthus lutarioriparius TaxID=422564 RepID=A0A811P4Y8_9POAL|nr:unnamed protein product [Miscanthus lutarioriparius]